MFGAKNSNQTLRNLEISYDNLFKQRKLFLPLNAELNPICHLLALLGGATIVVVSGLRVNFLYKCYSILYS